MVDSLRLNGMVRVDNVTIRSCICPLPLIVVIQYLGTGRTHDKTEMAIYYSYRDCQQKGCSWVWFYSLQNAIRADLHSVCPFWAAVCFHSGRTSFDAFGIIRTKNRRNAITEKNAHKLRHRQGEMNSFFLSARIDCWRWRAALFVVQQKNIVERLLRYHANGGNFFWTGAQRKQT